MLQALAKQCPEICELQISWYNHGSCEWLDLLGNIKKLKVLHLSGCFKCLRRNTFGMLTPFRNLAGVLSRLSELHLAYCCIDDKRLAILCSKAKLNYLKLQHCHYITDAFVLNLAVVCPTLQFLTVSQCAMIRSESIDDLQKTMTKLVIIYHGI
ncbi:F-box/LRR-repeat protein 7-like [Anopheles albimanus]|uniref:F-box/LRR-repeat protein 7-like n=1 Tax=Anopheles albimanus TaxID=7167 RepID=UPI00163FBBB3|nr:F-box/LRR-repeat protein 7-like [Anopheles albimanus]